MRTAKAPPRTPQSPTMTTTIKNLPRTFAIASLAFAAMLSLRADTRTFSLEAVEPGFWHLFDHNAKLTRVATGFGFTEGPVREPSSYLWASDRCLLDNINL